MNLIVTCSRHLEEEASEEIFQILSNLGDKSAQIQKTDFSGLIIVNTFLNPLLVIKEIKNLIMEEPWKIRYCLRFIPIEKFAQTEIETICDSVKNLVTKMKQSDTYRITIEKRGYDLSSSELINSLANKIQNKVSLDGFDWNIIIEIIGKITGISVIGSDDIISTVKLKRDSTE